MKFTSVRFCYHMSVLNKVLLIWKFLTKKHYIVRDGVITWCTSNQELCNMDFYVVGLWLEMKAISYDKKWTCQQLGHYMKNER